MEMKTAQVWIGNDVDGHAEPAEQLATFAYYINGSGRQFRFVVTRRANGEARVTHRLTGLSIAAVNAASSLGDWLVAGKGAVDALVAQKGADRVRDVLTRAETVGYGLLRGKSAA
jgi:hypothetical protein